MEENINIPDIEGYLTVSQAAKELGLTYKTTHRHVTRGRIKAVKAADVYMIPQEAIASFKRGLSGRPRTSVPQWHFSPDTNELIGTTIEANLREGIEAADLKRALATIKQGEKYLFKGTIARYIMSDRQTPRRVQFLLIWRQTVMPDDAEIEAMLKDLRAALAGVLDWETAHYGTSQIWMHT
jgi:excisionase family DNA binding protein